MNKIIDILWKIWSLFEGSELEPKIFHSHYLTGRLYKTRIIEYGFFLRGKVLDVGAGTGYGKNFIDQKYTEYFPVDLPTGRDSSCKNISVNGIKPYVYCTGYSLPFKDSCFGGVLLLSVLEHVKKPQEILSEAYRVLRPGGSLLVVVPFAFPVHGFPDDYRRWTLEGLKCEAELGGFEVSREISVGNAISSIVININIFLRYGLIKSGKISRLLVSMFMPFVFLVQTILNCAAIILGGIDKSNDCPTLVSILAKKPQSNISNN